jgi:hypothetical protein
MNNQQFPAGARARSSSTGGNPPAPAAIIPESEPFWALPLTPPVFTCAASSPRGSLRPSQLGVEALLAQALDAETARLLCLAYSPLFPDASPYHAISDIPEQRQQRDGHILKAVASGLARHQAELTAAAGEVAAYLHYTEDDVRDLAMKLAKQPLPPHLKLKTAQLLLGVCIPGKTLVAQLARLCDARYWRRALRVRILRAREHFFLRLHLIGRTGEVYASEAAVVMRAAQLKRQAAWMKDTVLVPRFYQGPVDGEKPYEPLTLEKVAPGPRERFAKLYTFVKAMDALSTDSCLSSAMVTLTLESEWHANPSNGNNRWNGTSPRDAHQSLCHRWQAILRDLHRVGVRMSGLRVAEPHKDACPHWHIWLLYRPEHETRILAAIMKYFPGKLKVRAPSRRGDKNTSGDVMFDCRDDLLVDGSRPVAHAKEGAQVEVSRINRDISSGASYAMKYLLKTVDGGDDLNRQAGLFPDEDAATTRKKEKHKLSAKRVDAYRSLWGINQGQLFGVAKCLTAWDEFRRLPVAPLHRALRKLWALARGSDKPGRVSVGASQRGDARGFLKALGGLDACRNGKQQKARRFMLGRMLEVAQNSYGEEIKRTKGLTLLMKQKVRMLKGDVDPGTGEVQRIAAWRTRVTVVSAVRTRLTEWALVPNRFAAQAMERAEKLFWQNYHRSTADVDADVRAEVGPSAAATST